MRMRGILAATATTVMVIGGVALAPAAHAATSTLSVDISGSDPMFGYYISSPPPACDFKVEPGHNYVILQLNVTESGSYVYHDLYEDTGTVDMGVAVYPLGTTFDPNSPTTNCIIAEDDDGTLDLSSGTSYTIMVTTYDPGTGTVAFTLEGPGEAYLGVIRQDASPKDLTVWQKAVGRATAEESCDTGWSPSWMQWPNDGQGGWVCVNNSYAYYPDEAVGA